MAEKADCSGQADAGVIIARQTAIIIELVFLVALHVAISGVLHNGCERVCLALIGLMMSDQKGRLLVEKIMEETGLKEHSLKDLIARY